MNFPPTNSTIITQPQMMPPLNQCAPIKGNKINLDNIIEQKENDFYFSPDKGNVIFASALDNWAFTLDTFSEILSNKFKFKKEVLKNVLWGDYYYSPKTKKIYKSPPSEKIRPIFVEFVLENIYNITDMENGILNRIFE